MTKIAQNTTKVNNQPYHTTSDIKIQKLEFAIGLLFKILFLIFSFLYFIFSLVMIKQIKIMRQTVKIPYIDFVFIIGFLNLFASIFAFLIILGS